MRPSKHYEEAERILREAAVANTQGRIDLDGLNALNIAASAHAALAIAGALVETHDARAVAGLTDGSNLVRYRSDWIGGEDGEEVTNPASDWARAFDHE